MLGGNFHLSADILYSVTDLGTLGARSSFGYALNDAGQVTGDSDAHAFLYRDGQMTDLGALGSSSSGTGINDAGQVVGYAYTSGGGSSAFVYRDGQMFNLNTLINPALGITLYDAAAINNNGQIVANLVRPGEGGDGTSHAYLLTPVPEPNTLALFSLALLGLGAWVRHHQPRKERN